MTYCLVLTCLFACFSTSATSLATPLDIVVGLNKPPYVIESGVSGFEVELVTEILKRMGYSTNFIFLPYGRTPKALGKGLADGIMTVNENVFSDPTFVTDSYIIYQNAAISLKSKNLAINNISDLSKYNIASFQMSSKVLGREFSNAVNISPSFLEIPDQLRQLKLLYAGRVDVLVMDVNIFKHYQKLYFKKNNISFDIQIHPIFSKNHYRMAFKHPEKIRLFNRAWGEVKHSDFYRDLLVKYELTQ